MRQRAARPEVDQSEQAMAATRIRAVCLALILPAGTHLMAATLPAGAARHLALAIWLGAAALVGLLLAALRRPRLAGAATAAVLVAAELALTLGGAPAPGYLSVLSLAFLGAWLAGYWALLRQMRPGADTCQRSEAQYRALVDNATDAIFTVDAATGMIVDANRRACALVGRSLAELRAMQSSQLHPPEEAAEARAAFSPARHPPGRGAPRMSALHADGRRIPVEVATSSVPGADGRLLVLGIFHDVSERRRAEQELQASEERFRATFEQAAVGMCHTSLDGRFLRINRRFCEISGYSRAELTEISFRELTHPDDLVADEALGRRLLAGELQTYAFEKRYIRKDGVVIWVNLTVSPVCGPSGAIEELLSVVEDITARKLAEWTLRQLNATLEERVTERTLALTTANSRLQAEVTVRRQVELALRESETRYRELLESLHQGVVVFQDDRVVFSNQAMCELLGQSVEDLLGYAPEHLRALIYADDRKHVASTIAEYFETGEVFPDRPFRFYRPDGELRWVYSWSRMIAYGGRPAVLGVISDVTDLKRAEDQLRHSRDELRAANLELARAARLKDEFLANMSHELRTPLNAVLGRAELLAEEIHGPLNERQRRSVASIEESGRHLLALINDILDIAKIEANRLDLQIEPVSVSDLCEASIRMIAETAERKEILIGCVIDPQVVLVQGDPRRLKQLLVNLLSNAVKFTPAGGDVGLEVRGDPEVGSVTFTVWDTGIGIAEEDLERLFRPFVQLDSKLSRQYEGTGLGLSLVARLARLHGGSVAVQSVPGRGSRFSATIPWQPRSR